MTQFRRNGDIPFVSNYEPNQINPVDARTLVDTAAHLTDATWWRGELRKDAMLYKGLLVTCQEDGNIYQYIGESRAIASINDVIKQEEWKQFKSNATPTYPLNYDEGQHDNLQIGHYISDGVKGWTYYPKTVTGTDAPIDFSTMIQGLYVDTKTLDGAGLYLSDNFVSLGSTRANSMTSAEKRASIEEARTKGDPTGEAFIPEYGDRSGIYIPTSLTYNGGEMKNLPLTVMSPAELGIAMTTCEGTSMRMGAGVSLESVDGVDVRTDGTLKVDADNGDVSTNNLGVMASTQITCSVYGEASEPSALLSLSSDSLDIEHTDRVTVAAADVNLRGGRLTLWTDDTELPKPETGRTVLCADDAKLGWRPVTDFNHFNLMSVAGHEEADKPADIKKEKFYIVGNENMPKGADLLEVERGLVTDRLYYDSTGNVFATAFYALSDERMKTDITDIPAWTAPHPRKFSWRDTSAVGYGFIAQELED